MILFDALHGYRGLLAALRPPFQRSLYDRGTGRWRAPEGLAAMMARLAVETKPSWTPPTLQERFVCQNCDAEHDGVDWHPNHVADVYCTYYEDAQ
ncbi:MAG: hypothetical protein PHS14_00380 [Elusimicrobia bacterium]|nr:hypothetical protein [Elusimicrobiota bacterium]